MLLRVRGERSPKVRCTFYATDPVGLSAYLAVEPKKNRTFGPDPLEAFAYCITDKHRSTTAMEAQQATAAVDRSLPYEFDQRITR